MVPMLARGPLSGFTSKGSQKETASSSEIQHIFWGNIHEDPRLTGNMGVSKAILQVCPCKTIRKGAPFNKAN